MVDVAALNFRASLLKVQLFGSILALEVDGRVNVSVACRKGDPCFLGHKGSRLFGRLEVCECV